MARVAVVTDSNSGITQEDAKALGCFVVPMPFMFGDDGTTYYEDINLTRDEFFRRLAADESVLTSQPAPTEILKLWDEVLKEYEQIVYIPMSSGLSGSCQSAMMLSSDYEGRVEVVNNQRISVTQKASVIDALELAKRGKSAQEIKDILERVKFDSSIYIMVDTLKYLKKGGRITPAAAAIGTLLRIKPVLQIKGERLDVLQGPHSRTGKEYDAECDTARYRNPVWRYADGDVLLICGTCQYSGRRKALAGRGAGSISEF